MSDKQDFKNWLKKGLQEALVKDNIKESLGIMADRFIDYFPDSKIWFAERLGKRVSYITGAGEESYLEAEEIPCDNGYIIFIENKCLNNRERVALQAVVRIITIIKE